MKAIRQQILGKHLFIFIIVLFQFLCTTLFAYWNFNLIQLKANSSSTTDQKLFYFYVDFSLSMFVSISISRQFSGGLINPAVALFRMFRRTQRFPVHIGILYIVVQLLAGLFGAFIAMYVNNITHAPIMGMLDAKTQVIAFITEIFGTGILTFMVQIISQKSMTFIQHNREFYICIPMYFLIGRSYSAKSNGVNPAFGLGFQVAYAVYSRTWQPIAMSYILIFGPFAGAFCAVMAFQHIYRPLYPVKPSEAKLKKIARQKQIEESKKYQNELKTINKPWTLNQIITLQPLPANNDQFQFTMIKESQYDDEIASFDDEDNEDNEQIQQPSRRRTFQL